MYFASSSPWLILTSALLLPGTSDVDRLVQKIERVAGMDPFGDYPRVPVFMAEVVEQAAEPRVRKLYAPEGGGG